MQQQNKHEKPNSNPPKEKQSRTGSAKTLCEQLDLPKRFAKKIHLMSIWSFKGLEVKNARRCGHLLRHRTIKQTKTQTQTNENRHHWQNTRNRRASGTKSRKRHYEQLQTHYANEVYRSTSKANNRCATCQDTQEQTNKQTQTANSDNHNNTDHQTKTNHVQKHKTIKRTTQKRTQN